MNLSSPLLLPLTQISHLPPSKFLSIISPMAGPVMVTAHALTHLVEMEFKTLLPTKADQHELLAEILIPPRIMRFMDMIYDAYLSSSTPVFMNMNMNIMDIYPTHLSNSQAISIMIWNVQGAGSPDFLSILKELIRVNKPHVLALVETHISGDTAQRVCDRINFSGKTRVDADGFRCGIWLFWQTESVSVNAIIHHPQHITVEVSRVGHVPWYFSAVYASPNPHIREELWQELEHFSRSINSPWLIAGDFNETQTL
ncbi:hypothetical protein RND81_07G139300 [Saponaria officinalis]|uniref:Endonuclease/exonuclease/phosphatase domain-containing protein n=1 Tax=Saponaria officinalis TaxID=3572 RepID=A0AAW1JUJ2_SAPOF